jgi:hypothetical protein
MFATAAAIRTKIRTVFISVSQVFSTLYI